MDNRFLLDEEEQQLAQNNLFEESENLIKEAEGFKERVYLDQNKNPTIGYGFNMNAPGTKELFKRYNLDPEAYITGQASLDKETADKMFRERKAELDKMLQNRIQRDMPDTQIDNRTLSTLQALNYNNPKLIGPGIKDAIRRNDQDAIAREILLRSNLQKNPGIQARRVKETEYFLGKDKFDKFVSTLSDDERMEIADMLGKIENEHTREQTLAAYPQLGSRRPAQNNFGPKIKKLLE